MQKKNKLLYFYQYPWRTHLYCSLPSSFLFRHSPLLLSGSFLSAPNRAFWSALFCPTGGKLKAHFRYSKSEHAEPVVENSKCSSRADSGQCLKHYCSWLWLISQRQAEPREAKCSALARPFWFARCKAVWRFVFLVCSLCNCAVSGSCLHSIRKKTKKVKGQTEGGRTSQVTGKENYF